MLAPPKRRAKPAPAGRPKLGIVLEGGGALGLAHIGVLQWMEEHRIPVSYVAGTSMGGLVGGIYATGRSPAEVKEITNGINWDEVLRGQTPFQDLSFRRKQDAHEVPNSLEFGLRKGLQFPGGFNTGQQVSLILDRVALPYSELKSFNDLPIPFACVATDLVSGKPHVFRSGPLSLALRSTMSLPGIFTPVRTGDHIYADGGLLNNIPIDVAKEMGADIVIGIHLETAATQSNGASLQLRRTGSIHLRHDRCQRTSLHGASGSAGNACRCRSTTLWIMAPPTQSSRPDMMPRLRRPRCSLLSR